MRAAKGFLFLYYIIVFEQGQTFDRTLALLTKSHIRVIISMRFYGMRNAFDDLKDLIDYVQTEYSEITNEWLCGADAKINLKKSQVSDVDVDGTIYKSILDYVQLLNERSASITLQLSSVCASRVTARVKAQNSIEYKIQSYKTDRHESGRVPINKCINDLLGIRIILDFPLTFEEIYSFIEATYPGKYRCINSSKLDYKAVHLYFKGSNHSFPWELQIWNQCDVESNFASHQKYKQEYTTWEKESKEGGIING